MKNKEYKKTEYFITTIMAIGLVITLVGFILMIKSMNKYNDYNITTGTVVSYKVTTEISSGETNTTNYLYTLNYTIDNKEYTSVVDEYTKERYLHKDKIKIISKKETPEKISLYKENDYSIIISIVGAIISLIGLLSHILIIKINKL